MRYSITLKESFYSLDIGEFDSLKEAVEYAQKEYQDVREVFNGVDGWSAEEEC